MKRINNSLIEKVIIQTFTSYIIQPDGEHLFNAKINKQIKYINKKYMHVLVCVHIRNAFLIYFMYVCIFLYFLNPLFFA